MRPAPPPRPSGILALALALGACVPPAEQPPPAEGDGGRPFKKRTVRILEKSPIPDPQTARYRDCLYTATAEVVGPERYAGQGVQLVLWAFRDRRLTDSAFLRSGDLATVKLLPYGEVAEVASVQLADTVSDIERPLMFAAALRRAGAADREPSETVEATEPNHDVAAQFEMLLHMRERLGRRGVELVLVPFPFREQVDGRFQFEDPAHRRFIGRRDELLRRLAQAQVEFVDLAAAFRSAAADGATLFYSGDDNHPAAGALDLAARQIADHLIGRGLVAARARGELSSREIAFADAPRYFARQVSTPDGLPVDLDRPSPLLVLADSFGEYPENTPHGSIPSANLAAQLALHVSPTPRNFTRSSGGATMPRVLARRPGLLEGVRCCVFVFSPYYPWVAGDLMWETVDF